MDVLRRRLSRLPDDVGALARGGSLNMVGSAVSAIGTFALVLVAARLFSAGEVGAFLVGVAVFTIVVQTTQLGAHVGMVRFLPGDIEQGRSERVPATIRVALLPTLGASVVAALALAIVAPQMASLFGQGEDAQLAVRHIRIMALFIPAATAATTLAQGSQGFGTMVPSALTDKIARPLLQLALVGAAAAVGPGALGIAWGLPYVLILIVLAPWVRRLTSAVTSAPGSTRIPGLARAFWRFTAPRGLATTFQVTILWIDTILIGAMLSVEQAGIYSVATRYLTVGHLAIAAVLQAIGPRLSAILATGDTLRAQSVYRTGTWWTVAIVWPLYLTVALFHEPLLRLFGEEYVAAGEPMVLLAGAMMLASACGAVDIVLLMGGRSVLSLGNWFGALVVNVVLNLVLIPVWGLTGAAAAWAASILVRNVIPLLQVRRYLGMDPFGRGYLLTTVSSLACFGGVGAVVRLTVGSSWAGLALATAIALVVYSAFLWRIRGELYEARRAPAVAPEADARPTTPSG